MWRTKDGALNVDSDPEPEWVLSEGLNSRIRALDKKALSALEDALGKQTFLVMEQVQKHFDALGSPDEDVEARYSNASPGDIVRLADSPSDELIFQSIMDQINEIDPRWRVETINMVDQTVYQIFREHEGK